jgi:hypothetical protein
MRRLFGPIGAALLCVAPALAFAAQPGGDRPTVPYREVERGLSLTSDLGAVFYFQLPGEGGTFSSGALIGIEAGYDLTPALELGAVVWGQAVAAPVTYEGITDPAKDPKDARGDFYSLLAGPSLRVSFLRFADDNGVDRTFVYGRGAAGLALNRPVGILEENGLFGTAALGVEYFTRLRHFSVGIEAGGIGVFVNPGPAWGATVLPHLTYTF